MVKAVIDIGSNSVILLIQRFENDHWELVSEKTWVTGLGHETKRTGLLSQDSMKKTLEALQKAHQLAAEYHPTQIIAAATMAVRMARNSNEFIELARNQGTPIIVLSGTEEAEYGFRSVADDPTFARYQRISIVDIGGQSTELVTAERLPKGWEILCKYSLPLGTLGLRSGVLHAESPDATAYLKAIKEIDSIIQLENLPSQAGQVITLGATGTNLVSIREKMTCWDPQKVHGAYVTRTETKRLLEWMFRMTDQQRSEIIGIEPGREKTLHIGALILERFLHALQAEGCLVSVRSWRHALLEKSI